MSCHLRGAVQTAGRAEPPEENGIVDAEIVEDP